MLFEEKGKRRGVKENQKLCSAVLLSELSLYAFTTVQKKKTNPKNFLKYRFTLGTFYKYGKQPKQLLLTEVPTKRKKQRHLVVYNISTFRFEPSSNDEMLLLSLYTPSFFKSLMMEICKHITLG